MKKILIRNVIVLAVAALGAAACASGTAVDSPTPAGVNDSCLINAPNWVLEQSANDGLSAVGSAAIISPAGSQFAYAEAIANARDTMEQSLEIAIDKILRDFTFRVTNIVAEQSISGMAADVSKRIENQTLQGIRPYAIFQSPCAELFVLLYMKPNAVRATVKNSILSAFSDENVSPQELNSEKTQTELDKAIAAEFPE